MEFADLNHKLLPTFIPITMASHLAGLSPATFKARCIATGALQVRDGGISLSELARWLGRPINIPEYLRADRKLDRARGKARAHQRRYVAARRAA